MPTQLDLADWDTATVTFATADGTVSGTATLTALTVVPEPGTAWLVAGGLASLASIRRRRRRQGGRNRAEPGGTMLR